ncbi:MAG TPA: alpha/beta fold hydrolase [Ktedonosporobacter sp.]|jgi:pimeloyl-ACP methyl ester carboxylesterase|nr:alpha/beta fold hydrolase [Ktedonosporobacter sp.]
MPELAAGPPLLRLALSPGVCNLAVLCEYAHQHTLEIINILPDGRLLETQRITQPIEYDVSALKWVSQEELLLVRSEGETTQLMLYRLHQGKLQCMLTTKLAIPARVIAASSRTGFLQVLLAISTEQGIRFGLFFPETGRYQIISGSWTRANFGAWNPEARILGVNVATASDERLQGIIYQYGETIDQTRLMNLLSITGKQGTISAFDGGGHACITACSDDGFLLPGSHTLATGETRWFKDIGFSAEALGFSANGELVICGGLVEANRRYVIAKMDDGLEPVDVDHALLLNPVFCQDPRYLLANYQTPGIAPTLCRYDRLAHTCEIVLHHPGIERAASIQGRHWWANVPTLERMPVISFTAPSTNYERILMFLHGGPHLNILQSYSPLLSRLVEQGFWVVAPNFPGSTGYGVEYEQMIRGDWGGVDVHSVIELAEMLIQRCQDGGQQISLYGVSYGGYLALLAAGLRPDLWNCVIAGAPFSDLQDLYVGANKHLKGSLQLELGPLLENEAELAARSPISYAHTLSRLPILLLHGADDAICPTRQSRRLASILAEQVECSKHFEYCELTNLKHELYSERFWAEMVINFLARHAQ